jgi:hypothetical protein
MDTGMEFELTMRLLFGEKAYNIAGLASHPTHRREWLQKAVRKQMRAVNELDTTPRHKRMLMAELEAVSLLLKGAKDPCWEVIYRLFRLTMRLLGYDYFRGGRYYTPTYHQTPTQYYTAAIFDGGDTMQDFYDRKNAIALRQQVVESLKKQGLDNFKISLVLNTTEYEIKQLRANHAVNRTRRKRRAG